MAIRAIRGLCGIGVLSGLMCKAIILGELACVFRLLRVFLSGIKSKSAQLFAATDSKQILYTGRKLLKSPNKWAPQHEVMLECQNYRTLLENAKMTLTLLYTVVRIWY